MDGRLAPPPGSPERGRYLQWLHFGEGSVMPPPAAVTGTAKGPDGKPVKVAPLTDEDALNVWDTNEMMKMFKYLFLGFNVFLATRIL